MLPVLRDWQLAYIAGLVDGEGCIDCSRVFRAGRSLSPSYTAKLRISLRTVEPVTAVAGWLGLPVQIRPRTFGTVYTLSIHGREMAGLLTQLLPYLILKRSQAEVALQMVAIARAGNPNRWGRGRRQPEWALAQMEAAYQRLHQLKEVPA